jgi:hypothetical protein
MAHASFVTEVITSTTLVKDGSEVEYLTYHVTP